MKTTTKAAPVLVAFGLVALAMTTGCADKGPPSPPPGVAVVGFVPDYCFWDGYEYVGWYGDGYYYWGPRHVWVICDPVRVKRVNVWMHAHPDFHTQATAMTHVHDRNAQPRVHADAQRQPVSPPHRQLDHDHAH
jgi:hypothetical protein